MTPGSIDSLVGAGELQACYAFRRAPPVGFEPTTCGL